MFVKSDPDDSAGAAASKRDRGLSCRTVLHGNGLVRLLVEYTLLEASGAPLLLGGGGLAVPFVTYTNRVPVRLDVTQRTVQT